MDHAFVGRFHARWTRLATRWAVRCSTPLPRQGESTAGESTAGVTTAEPGDVVNGWDLTWSHDAGRQVTWARNTRYRTPAAGQIVPYRSGPLPLTDSTC